MTEAFTTRIVTSNPLPMDGSGFVAPQQVHAIPRATDTDPLVLSTTLDPWTAIAGLQVQGPSTIPDMPRNVYFNNVKGKWVNTTLQLLLDLQWTWNGSQVVILDTGVSDPATHYGGPIVANYQTYTPIDGVFADRNYRQLRTVFHPDFRNNDGTTGLLLPYPSMPDRTKGYYANPIRKMDINVVQTLQGSVNAMEAQRWEDVVITETWTGGGPSGNRLSMLSEFFMALHLMRMTIPTIGRFMSWCPFDLSFGRHLIEPIALSIGTGETEVHEIRDRLESGVGSYLAETVTWSFKLISPIPQAGSLITFAGT